MHIAHQQHQRIRGIVIATCLMVFALLALSHADVEAHHHLLMATASDTVDASQEQSNTIDESTCTHASLLRIRILPPPTTAPPPQDELHRSHPASDMSTRCSAGPPVV